MSFFCGSMAATQLRRRRAVLHCSPSQKGGVLVSTDDSSTRRHVEEAWLASLKPLGTKINANDYEDLALAA